MDERNWAKNSMELRIIIHRVVSEPPVPSGFGLDISYAVDFQDYNPLQKGLDLLILDMSAEKYFQTSVSILTFHFCKFSINW